MDIARARDAARIDENFARFVGGLDNCLFLELLGFVTVLRGQMGWRVVQRRPCARNIRASFRLWSQTLLRAKGNEMITANETLQRAAASTARNAADAGQRVGESISEFANDVTRKAEKKFARVRNMAADAYGETMR